MSTPTRKAVLIGTMKQIDFKDLKRGDLFRLIKSCVEDTIIDERVIWRATSDPYLNENDILTVSVEEDFLERLVTHPVYLNG